MHFYDFNIGDYAKKTAHLSNEEDIAYRRALDMYYDTEQPFNLTSGLATLSRRLRVSENALKNVIDEFFPEGKNKHADEKIAEYYAYIEKQKVNGSKGGRPKHKPTANPLVSQNNPTPSQPLTTKPLTTNQEPLKSTSKDMSAPAAQTVKKGTRLPDDWVLPKKWGEFALAEKPDWLADDVRRVAADFKDHWLSNANQAKSKKYDWFATWRKWVRSPLNEIKKNAKSHNVQDARLDIARQIFSGGNNGNDRQIIDINHRPANQSIGACFPEVDAGIWQPDDGEVARFEHE